VNGHLWGATQNLAELDGPKYQALVRLADELPKENDQPVEDGTERNLWLVGVTGDHNNNRYKCTITNADGSVTSNTVTLHVTGGVTGTTAALPSKANAGRLTVSGSVAAIGLAGPQQWTMELRGLDGALVRRATGFGAEASVRLPAARTAFVAQVTTGGRTVARGLVTAR